MYGRKKQIMAGLLALFIFLTFRGVFAEDGTCGINVKYTVSGNTISFAKGDGAEAPKWDDGAGRDCGAVFEGDAGITSVKVTEKISVRDGLRLFSDIDNVLEMDLSELDVSAVTDMSYMFYGCSSLESLDVSGWDTSAVTEMDHMFEGCSSLTSVDVSGWVTSAVTNMSNVFEGCANLNTLALGKNTVGTNTGEQNIFGSLPEYDSTWYYLKEGTAAENPLPLKTGKTGDELFRAYDSVQMAGVWSTHEDLVLTDGIRIEYPVGTDVTGETVPVDSTEVQLAASASPDGAGQKFFWKSSDISIAVVNGNGKVTFRKGGTVTITAAAADASGEYASVTLKTDIKATNVVIKNSQEINITGKTTKVTKQTYQLKASAEPEAFASQNVTWKSSNTKIAAVSKTGMVSFKKAGTVKITATAADGSGKSASVTLQTDIKATKVTIRNAKGKVISHKTLKIKKKTVTVRAAAVPAKYAAQKFTWKTSNKKIATVKNGKVTFKKAGTVKITATAKDGSRKSNWVKITYKPASK